MSYPTEGVVTDAAHSMKNGVTEYQGKNLSTGERIFYKYLGNQTTNIGEFLGAVAGIKYILQNNFSPRIIYTDSKTAISWIQNKSTSSSKKNMDIKRAEVFLKLFSSEIESIEIRHWNSSIWGENPADFGNK
ncbi:MAG: reverse transcriptase-like protein [Tannerellaceae bacterium]|nr:reverse transcriptase-like protein [Tannerellaceae bacterium]MCD8263348.1 reverse transcriptase-like protein [Tannerellaceae bacterium]